MELHKRSLPDPVRGGPCHGLDMYTQVFDLYSLFAAHQLSNLLQAQQARALRADAARLPTKLSTKTVDGGRDFVDRRRAGRQS
jgi:hypothetical protein